MKTSLHKFEKLTGYNSVSRVYRRGVRLAKNDRFGFAKTGFRFGTAVSVFGSVFLHFV